MGPDCILSTQTASPQFYITILKHKTFFKKNTFKFSDIESIALPSATVRAARRGQPSHSSGCGKPATSGTCVLWRRPHAEGSAALGGESWPHGPPPPCQAELLLCRASPAGPAGGTAGSRCTRSPPLSGASAARPCQAPQWPHLRVQDDLRDWPVWVGQMAEADTQGCSLCVRVCRTRGAE